MEPYLLFEVSGAEYALPLGQVEEIVPLRSLGRSAAQPASLAGWLGLRGEPVAIVDLAAVLGEAPCPLGAQSCAMIAQGGREEAGRVGLAVAETRGVLELEPAAIAPAPRLAALAGIPLLAGVARLESRLLPILDLERLLGTEEALTAVRAPAEVPGSALVAEPRGAEPAG